MEVVVLQKHDAFADAVEIAELEELLERALAVRVTGMGLAGEEVADLLARMREREQRLLPQSLR